MKVALFSGGYFVAAMVAAIATAKAHSITFRRLHPATTTDGFLVLSNRALAIWLAVLFVPPLLFVILSRLRR
jgi:hypothetical protein